MTTTNLQSENSTQQQIHNEHIHVPLQAATSSKEEPVSPGSPTPNDDYTPVDLSTLSWEVARDDVEVEKVIGRGAFGQVAKGMARNLPFRSEATSVAIKMVKGKVFFFLTHFLVQLIIIVWWFQFDHGRKDCNKLKCCAKNNSL